MSLSQLQPEQKAHGEHHGDRMPVKARPQPTLILVRAQFLFGLLVELLDRVAAMGIVDQLLQRGRGWQVTPIVLVLFGLPRAARSPNNQPMWASPSAVIRQARTATNFLRNHPLVPCRQRTVRHWRRATATNAWSARWDGVPPDASGVPESRPVRRLHSVRPASPVRPRNWGCRHSPHLRPRSDTARPRAAPDQAAPEQSGAWSGTSRRGEHGLAASVGGVCPLLGQIQRTATGQLACGSL